METLRLRISNVLRAVPGLNVCQSTCYVVSTFASFVAQSFCDARSAEILCKTTFLEKKCVHQGLNSAGITNEIMLYSLRMSTRNCLQFCESLDGMIMH